jgi:hypothetical protein
MNSKVSFPIWKKNVKSWSGQTILNGKKNTTEIKMKIVQEMGFLRRLRLVFSD